MDLIDLLDGSGGSRRGPQVVLLGYFCALQYAHLLGSAPANARELGSDDVDFAGREVLAAALAILGQCAAPPGMQSGRP